ncbi:inner membrane protein oxaA [Glaciecola punicea ACAM 611]|jgi:YidC/Oxa1 family membrane protein insertase|uniref:Membrane protein insertase YidC n=1 Tax=Glaciecola punicea ACAM 611 TaxID=1121923 RepID=H5TDX5_9ALTE|nr:membrane protein insertase YidC [Glaciecola punicea]OFA31049.1 membrane protein insertase YidC [Glaciecola punicea]GAB56502.1 inner membrane protein oxaA [Glaciecola punicea ACAM 611]
MESQKSILIIGLLLVSFLLWTNYQRDNSPQTVTPTVSDQSQDLSAQGSDLDSYLNDQSLADENSNGEIEEFTLDATNGLVTSLATPANSNRIITVTTDTLDIKIDLNGGDVIEANLIKFPVTRGSNDSYPLLKPQTNVKHIAQSFLIGAERNTNDRALYTSEFNDYELTGNSLSIPLSWRNDAGLIVTKTFVFTRDSHLIDVSYDVTNNTNAAINFAFLARLEQTTNDVGDSSMFMPVFRGAAYSTADDIYEKLSFGKIADGVPQRTTTAGWIAMIEHYFVAAWIPPQEDTNTISSRATANTAIISITGKPQAIAPNGQGTLTGKLYVGPKDQETLAGIAKGLDLTVDYGPLWWLSQQLFLLLQFLHGFVMNWGVAIILITLIVKGAMFWLTKKQYESMAKMRALQPKLTQLKDRFGDDRQKMSQAMMELYKKEKVNPMGGCFPLLLQMPIFLALYWVLLESVELRHAPFTLWITDLSVPDPFFVLPILTGASMFLLQKLQPMTIQDPLQQKLMTYMPVAMSIFFFFFPAGLVLYWLVSNLVTLIQAKIIYASMEKRGLQTK